MKSFLKREKKYTYPNKCRDCRHQSTYFNEHKCEKCGCKSPQLSKEEYSRIEENRISNEGILERLRKENQENPKNPENEEYQEIPIVELPDATLTFYATTDHKWVYIANEYTNPMCKVQYLNGRLDTRHLYFQNCQLLYQVSELSKSLQDLTKKFESFESRVEMFPGGNEYEKTKQNFENLQNKE